MTAPRSTFVGVLVHRTYATALAARVRECGDAYRYETHQSDPRTGALSLRVACLCPGGHGVAGIPWRGWFDTTLGRFDLADVDLADLAARHPEQPAAPAPLTHVRTGPGDVATEAVDWAA